MIPLGTATLDSMARRRFAEAVVSALRKARPDREVDAAALIATVERRFDAAKGLDFTSEADCGLYCLAWHLAPKEMASGDLGRTARDPSLSLAERRYRLKAALDRMDLLPFGAHEARPAPVPAPETT